MLRKRGRPGHKTMSYHKDGWMDEKMNGQMDKCTYVVSLSRAKLDPSGPQTTCAIRRPCVPVDALRWRSPTCTVYSERSGTLRNVQETLYISIYVKYRSYMTTKVCNLSISVTVISHLSLLKIYNLMWIADRAEKTFYKREICKLASIPGKVISSSDQGRRGQF